LVDIQYLPVKTFLYKRRIKCIIVHLYTMTKKLRSKKDYKLADKDSNEIPSLKDYKSKEE